MHPLTLHLLSRLGWVQVLQKTGASKEGDKEDAGQGAGSASKGGAAAELDTLIVGPWMDNWPLVHTNRHVDAWLAGKQAITKA